MAMIYIRIWEIFTWFNKCSCENAGAEIITLALRSANLGGSANILDYIPKNVTLLPNTSIVNSLPPWNLQPLVYGLNSYLQVVVFFIIMCKAKEHTL